MMGSRTVASKPQHQGQLPFWIALPLLLFCIWAIVSLETGVWNTYRLADYYGWIEHDHDTPVWVQGDWMRDEYRICEMPGNLWGKLPDSAHLLCGIGDPRAIDGVWPATFRDDLSDREIISLQDGRWDFVEHYFHVLPVHYWGRIDRTDSPTYSWRCQKEFIGLVCKALN